MWSICRGFSIIAAFALISVWTLGQQTAFGQEYQPKKSSKIAYIVEQLAYNCYEAFAGGATDVSGLSSSVLHVKPSGYIELLFHAASETGASEESDLEASGQPLSVDWKCIRSSAFHRPE